MTINPDNNGQTFYFFLVLSTNAINLYIYFLNLHREKVSPRFFACMR